MAMSRAVLITGCSTGIGRATAKRFAAQGWPVYATARRPDTLADLGDLGAKVLPLDVTDEASMLEAVAMVEAEHGAVGVLVNNAGYGLEGPFELVSMDEVRRQFETNVFGLVRLTQLVLPRMRAQGWGRIVNLSSMGGRLTFPGGGYYHATKYAVEALSDALRYEVRPFGVRVVVVEPGPVVTQFGDTAVDTVVGGDHPEYGPFVTGLKRRITDAYDGWMTRLADGPDDIARVIERAAASDRPRARYLVGAPAKSLVTLRRILPDRAWDAAMRLQFPPARPARTEPPAT